MQGKRLKIEAGSRELKAAWEAVERKVDTVVSRLNAIERTHVVYETDPAGVFTYVNAVFAAVYGYRLHELEGQTPRMLKSEKHPPGLYAEMWRTITAGKAWSGLLINRGKDGVLKKTYTSILPKPNGYVAVAVDLTPFAGDPVLWENSMFVGSDGRLFGNDEWRDDHKKLVDALETVRALADEHRRNYEHAQETIRLIEESERERNHKIAALDAAALVSITDPDGFIVEINDYFAALTRFNESDIVGKRHHLLRSPHTPNEVFDEMWQTITQGKDWRGILQNLAADGQELWLQTTIHPVFDENGTIEKYVSVQIDVTETLELLIAARDEVEKQRKELFDYRNKVAELTRQVRTLMHKLKQAGMSSPADDDISSSPLPESHAGTALAPPSRPQSPIPDAPAPAPPKPYNDSSPLASSPSDTGAYVLSEALIDHYEYCLAVGNYDALQEWTENIENRGLADEVLNALENLDYSKLHALMSQFQTAP
jgi:PAS domain S-box-containing protein